MDAAQQSLQRSTAKVAATAEALEQSADLQLASANRRTDLAATRTVLAAERTYAAWIRTGLTSMAFGIGAKALLDTIVPSWLASLMASFILLFAASCFVAGVWRQLWPGARVPDPETRRLPLPFLIGVNGFLVLVCLAALIGTWMVDL